MYNIFEIGQLVSHKGVVGKKFRIQAKITDTQYEIQDLTTKEIYTEPSELLLDIVESRDFLINYLINEK